MKNIKKEEQYNMNMNPMMIMQLKQRLSTFNQEHPRVMPFFSALQRSSLTEGTIIDMKVTDPNGEEMQCNIKLTANDIETFQMMMNMKDMQL